MKETTVEELKQLMDQGADFQLIDVREPNEYQMANLGGELIPLSKVLQESDKISRDKPVIVHCRSGKRSATAIQHLEKEFGFDNLSNLKGGIVAYKNAYDPSLNVS